MTEQLHERLADLAGDVATPAPLDPAGLWRTGKRRQRRRTAAAAVAACAAVLAGVSGAGLLLPSDLRDIGPSATKTAPALPDRLYAPSRWLESNDDDPAGPFAVLTLDQHNASSDGLAYVGVSAATGEYRRVELPGVRDDGFGQNNGSAVLSPSGRYIVYWAAPGEEPVDENSLLPGHVGVYDTVAGRDLGLEWQLADGSEAPHGLAVWDLRWVDDSRFYVQAGAIEGAPGTDGASATQVLGPGWLIGVPKAGPARLLEVPGAAKTADVFAGDGAGHLLVRAKGRPAGYLVVDPQRPGDARSAKVVVPGDAGTGGQVWSSSEGRVAMATQTARGAAALVVTQVDGTSQLLDAVPAWDVYGWSDPTHVVVGAAAAPGDKTRRSSIVEVDVRTGASRPLVALPASGLNPPQLATDLLDVPPVHRAEPDWPTDPRVFVALGLGAVVMLLGALRIWRRREQR